MAFDQSTRNRLQRFVSDARSLLSEELTRQLQQEYGLDPATGEVADLSKLDHLDDSRLETARVLRQILVYYLASEAIHNGEKGNKVVLERIVREQAFTVLNRLASLRMMEARGLLIESIASGYQSQGFQLYDRIAGQALGETGDTYRHFLFSLFDEFAFDLKVLFDRYVHQGLLFPRESALLSLLALINDAEIEPLWAEDETIGWIYQYWNSKEERKAMRDASAAPRNSRELAVRNQFFTPRYVVEFLTDNTLGRIWYEMTKGETRLADACRYLVRRPTEIFLSEGEAAPEPPEGATEETLSQEELLKQPVHIPHRPVKDPREIRLLDPACGSMHFGLYAFDLFEAIYEEAWDKGLCPVLQEVYPAKEDYLRDVPRLIIEHNIHGVDIDPRAVQIAGLSLWLRAQKSWKDITAADRPRIRRSNIVCAEPMPGSGQMLEDFVQTLDPPLLGELVRTVFDKMQLAGEAGTLLKIEEEIRTAIDDARKAWDKLQRQSLELFSTDSQLTGDFFDTAEERIYAALSQYAESAEAGDYQRRLFAEDAAHGFAFIDLCRKRYDAVVMNPPFGGPSVHADFVVSNSSACSNLYCAFVIEGIARVHDRGRIGAITDRSFVVKADYEDYREWLYSVCSPEILIDLGWEVLDANVEVCIYVVSRDSAEGGLFGSVTAEPPESKDETLLRLLQQQTSEEALLRFIHFDTFRNIPKSSMSYLLPSTLLRDFENGTLIGKHWGNSARGMSSGKTAFACRLLWEIPQTEFGRGKKWNAANVGGGKAVFYRPTFMVFYHDRDWGCMKAFKGFSLKNTDLFWRPAIGWGKRTDLLSCQLLSSDTITAEDGQLFKPMSEDDIWMLLAFLNSKYAQTAVHAICGGHKAPGYVGNIPLPRSITRQFDELSTMAQEGYSLQRQMTQIDETAPDFACFKVGTDSTWIEQTQAANSSKLKRCEQLLRQIDALVFDSLGKSSDDVLAIEEISPGTLDATNEVSTSSSDLASAAFSHGLGASFGRWDIRYATGERQPPELPDPFDPLPVCPPGMLQNADGLPAAPADVPDDYPLRITWPGILVDDDGNAENIVARVRDALAVIWGERSADIEQEACEILGVRDLRDYFAEKKAGGKFFKDHLKRYSKSRRKAPIYWPLSTKSGSYTVWIYYHRLTDQTLYTCVNDFVEPKLRQVIDNVESLRKKADRTKSQEQELSMYSDLKIELEEFRDELLRVAKTFKPNLNDGVQITAAPLWLFFRLKPWQKVLKDTWQKLEKGDYDWAHLTMSYWPDRVREKCKTDKSLAIAHGLEDVYQEASG